MNFFKRIFGEDSAKNEQSLGGSKSHRFKDTLEQLIWDDFTGNRGNWSFQGNGNGTEKFYARNSRGYMLTVSVVGRGVVDPEMVEYEARCGHQVFSPEFSEAFGAAVSSLVEKAAAEEKSRLAAVERERLMKLLKS